MANVLAHGLVALALHSLAWRSYADAPLTGYGFLAAWVALLPDLELGRDADATPAGHSLGYGVLWLLLASAGLALGAWLALLPEEAFVPLLLAVLVGLGSHWGLDALTPPGLWSLPRRSGGWGRLPGWLPVRRRPVVNLAASGLSVATLLLLVVVA